MSWQEVLVTGRRQDNHIWHPDGPLGCLLVVLYLSVVVKDNATALSSKGHVTRSSEPSGTRIWVTLAGESLRPIEVPAEG